MTNVLATCSNIVPYCSRKAIAPYSAVGVLVCLVLIADKGVHRSITPSYHLSHSIYDESAGYNMNIRLCYVGRYITNKFLNYPHLIQYYASAFRTIKYVNIIIFISKFSFIVLSIFVQMYKYIYFIFSFQSYIL